MRTLGARAELLERGLLLTMRGIFALVMATATVVAGCGGASHPGSEDAGSATVSRPELTAPSASIATPPRSAAASEEVRRGRMVKTAGSAYGPMLFDRSGQAIYLFDRETTSTPECYGACAEAWPPVLTQALPQASGVVRSQLLGTTRRKDGLRQVTYNGHPLYFYAHEDENEVLCHHVSEFGGLWLVVTPDGEPAA